MGVIQRQGIKDSIVAYAGVALGAVNTLFIYTRIPADYFGLYNFLLSTSMLLGALLQMGMPNVSLRFFSTFRTEDNRHNGFLFLLLLPTLIAFGIFIIISFIIAPYFQENLIQSDKQLIAQFLYYLIPLAFFIAVNGILTYYIKNFLRIVVPTLLDSVWLKVAAGGLSLLLAYSIINLSGFVNGIVMAYGIVTLGLLLYARWLGQLNLRPNFAFLDKPLLRQIRIFALYGILGSVGGNLMTQIDRTMIPLLMEENGTAANGIFSIVAYIGTTIDIPRKSLEKIAAPAVAHAIAENDWAHVGDLYKRTSINLFVIGTLLFLGIWLNLDSIFAIMAEGEKYAPARNIVFILGIASLIDMVTSINTHIIAYSRYFRVAFYIILVLAGLNIGFNYLFIKTFGFGIEGAALATLASIVIFNGIKLFYIYRTFKMQPFSNNIFWVLVIGVLVFIVVSMLPHTGIALLDICYRSLTITILYIIPILYFRLSLDVNHLLLKIWNQVRQRLNF